jgi:carboxylesterase
MNSKKHSPVLYRYRKSRCLGPASEEDIKLAKAACVTNDSVGHRVGVLLIHGFIANAYSMHQLKHGLEACAYQISVPLLPGHGGAPEDMAGVTLEQWIECVYAAYEKLRQSCESVIVVGQSLGGVLSTLIEYRFRSVEQLILLAPAFNPPWILSASPVLVPICKFFGIRYFPNIAGDVMREDAYDVSFKKIHIDSYIQLKKACELGRDAIKTVTCPVTMFCADKDHTIHKKGVKRAYDSCPSTEKQWVMLNDSYHLISLDNQFPVVIDAIKSAIDRLTS